MYQGGQGGGSTGSGNIPSLRKPSIFFLRNYPSAETNLKTQEAKQRIRLTYQTVCCMIVTCVLFSGELAESRILIEETGNY